MDAVDWIFVFIANSLEKGGKWFKNLVIKYWYSIPKKVGKCLKAPD